VLERTEGQSDTPLPKPDRQIRFTYERLGAYLLNRMEISFATEALKEACLARQPKSDNLPREVVGALHAFYNAMRNADHVRELPFGQPESSTLSGNLEWRIGLANGYNVIVRANHAKPPLNDNGIDWARVHRVQVIAIEGPNA
jgi:hypothetical protein